MGDISRSRGNLLAKGPQSQSIDEFQFGKAGDPKDAHG